MIGGRAWCDTCHSMREIVDESEEAAYTAPKIETTFWVTTFACGHSSESRGKDTWLTW